MASISISCSRSSWAIDAASMAPREGLEIANALLDAGVLIPS
jgi:hypothetical protein